MLVTATNELKFHHWPDEGPDEPYNLSITSKIVSISWSKDNNFMIYLQDGGRPEILSLKDFNNIKPIHIITAIDNATVAMFQKKTKKCVAIGTTSATVALYDTKTKSIGKLFSLPAAVIALDFNSNDEYLVVACASGAVSLLNVLDGTEACSYNVGGIPTGLCFHLKNPNIFAVATKEGSVFVFDVQEPNPIYLLRSHFGTVNGLVFLIKQDALMTVGEDNKYCLHDLKQKVCTYRGYLQYPLTGVDITPDGKHVAIATNEGSVAIFETKNLLSPLITLMPHSTRIHFLKFAHKQPPDDVSDTTGSIDTSNHTDITTPTKVCKENEFKSLYNKFLNSSDDDDETLKLLRDDIVADIKKDADQLHMQMSNHMSNLQDFIRREFEKMTLQMDDKWNILNMASDSYKSAGDIHSDELLYDTENPIVLE